MAETRAFTSLPPIVAPVGLAHPVLASAAFFAGYVALDWVSYIHPMQQYSITPWNPQPALAIALLMKGGQRYLPLVFAAVVTAAWVVRGGHGTPGATLLVCGALSLGYAAVAAALVSRGGIRPALSRAGDVLRLVAIVAAGTLITGTLYIAALMSVGAGPLVAPYGALVRFWIGDAAGVVVTLPFVLMLADAGRRSELLALLRRRDAALLFGILVATMVLILLVPPYNLVRFFYVLFLPLILVATRLGLCGATLAALAIQGAIVVSGEVQGYQVITIFELQSLLIALAVTGLFLGVVVDERERAAEELRRSMRLAAAGEMAAALAHELNQPLTAALTYARAGLAVARQASPTPGLLEDTLAKLVGEASRAADVLRKLRDFFRTGATDLRDTSLPELAHEAVASARASAPDVSIIMSPPGALPPVLADATQLGVVLRNLLANAIEAARHGGARRVEITCATAGEGVLLRVSDSGPGVAAASVERIFEPFETSRAQGMGMGLAISRAIAEAHGGRLWAVASGHGDFRLWIPAKEAAAHE